MNKIRIIMILLWIILIKKLIKMNYIVIILIMMKGLINIITSIIIFWKKITSSIVKTIIWITSITVLWMKIVKIYTINKEKLIISRISHQKKLIEITQIIVIIITVVGKFKKTRKNLNLFRTINIQKVKQRLII